MIKQSQKERTIMRLTIKMNDYLNLTIKAQKLEEFQDLIQKDDIKIHMENYVPLIEYLESHDNEFMNHIFDYFRDQDEGKLKQNINQHLIPVKAFKSYIAHCFNIPETSIIIKLF